MTAAVAVNLCACGHGERLHERDSGSEHDRGVCFKTSCGCAEYRPAPPGEPYAAFKMATGPDGEDVAAPVTAAAKPVETPAPVSPVPPPQVFPCPVCGKEFTSPQGAGGHRAKAHPRAATQTGPAAVPPATAAAPAQQAAGAQAGAESGEASRFDPGPAPAPTPVEDDGRRHDAAIRIDLGDTQHVTFHAEKVTAAVLHDFITIIERFLTPTTGATTP